MDSVPKRRVPIDRSKPPDRDDPVISALTDEQVWALDEVLARLIRSAARRLEQERAEGAES